MDGLINLKNAYQNNPLIGYININSLTEKVVSVREGLPKASIDILCVDKTKLDASFPDHQFKISGYQFPPIRRDRNSKGRRKIVFVREGFIVKQMKNIETENAETICLELVIAKKKWCILFAYRAPDINNVFFNEMYITLDRILGNYDNILLAGELNIDELKTGSDSSNHLSNVKDVFNLTNLFKKPTCFKLQDETLIDLMLTNRPISFLKSQNFEMRLNDYHKLIVNIQRASFKNPPRKIITYRDQKRFNHVRQDHFLRDLDSRLLQGELYRNCDESYKNLLKFLIIYSIITPH